MNFQKKTENWVMGIWKNEEVKNTTKLNQGHEKKICIYIYRERARYAIYS